MVGQSMKSNRVRLGLLALLLVGGFLVFWANWSDTPNRGSTQLNRVRLAIAPYPDTTNLVFGDELGVFTEAGLTVDRRDVNWAEQLELLAAGGVDICMATLDEFVTRERNFRNAGRPLVYFLPAWKFEGLTFAANNDIVPLAQLATQYPRAEARKRFVSQLKGRLLAIPEHSVFDQAIRKLMSDVGEDSNNFTFINTTVEAGLNGLSDARVALAAIGNSQRAEAQGRSYQLTPTSADLDSVVLTGFVTTRGFYDSHFAEVQAFGRAWYRTVELSHQLPEKRFAIGNEYLSQRGARVWNFEQFSSALAESHSATNAAEALRMFNSRGTAGYWKSVWESTSQSLLTSGGQPPQDESGFVALDFLSLIAGSTPNH
jgi:ABC-type nitrate/sulfonate/bicarbonate transport system substrate-binding protein